MDGGFVFGDQDIAQHGALDIVVIASFFNAMLIQHFELVFYILRRADEVAHISNPSHRAQCELFTRPTDQNRRMWFLTWLGFKDGVLHMEVFAVKRGAFFRPHGFDQFNGFFESIDPLGGFLLIFKAVLLVFRFIPTRTDSECDTSVADEV